MEQAPEQEALFEIEGPDEDGCVWIGSPKGRDVWCQNVGPKDKVADVLSRWLDSIDYGGSSPSIDQPGPAKDPGDQTANPLPDNSDDHGGKSGDAGRT